jgi:hypothetical protein
MSTMRRTASVLTAFLFLATVGASQARSLSTTFDGGNENDGSMFDVTASSNVILRRLDAHFLAGALEVEVYHRTGSYHGFEDDAGAWTLLGRVPLTGLGAGLPTPIPLALDLSLEAGETCAFYVTNTDAASQPNIVYTAGSGVVYSNPDLCVFEGLGLAYPFGDAFEPRAWNGTIHYELEGVNATPKTISIAAGGAQSLMLSAGAEHSGLFYIVLGTTSGTSGGIPVGTKSLPLHFDAYTFFTLASPNTPPLAGSLGLLDAGGEALAQFSIGAGVVQPAFAGLELHHAFIVLDVTPTLVKVPYVSAPAGLVLVP